MPLVSSVLGFKMKKVLLQRAWQDYRCTLGMLTVLEHEHDPIFTLENPFRYGMPDDRIPSGVYECSPFSGAKYKDVYEIKNVPGRAAILIHWGNFERDTLGCVLVGNGAGMMTKEPAVAASRACFNRLKDLLGEDDFLLTVVDVGAVCPSVDRSE